MRVFFLVGLAVVLWASMGCDEGRTLIIDNRSSDPVQVVESGIPTRTVAPGEALELTALAFSGLSVIEVTTVCDPPCDSPRLLATLSLTWEDYKEDPIIVIEQMP